MLSFVRRDNECLKSCPFLVLVSSGGLEEFVNPVCRLLNGS